VLPCIPTLLRLLFPCAGCDDPRSWDGENGHCCDQEFFSDSRRRGGTRLPDFQEPGEVLQTGDLRTCIASRKRSQVERKGVCRIQNRRSGRQEPIVCWNTITGAGTRCPPAQLLCLASLIEGLRRE